MFFLNPLEVNDKSEDNTVPGEIYDNQNELEYVESATDNQIQLEAVTSVSEDDNHFDTNELHAIDDDDVDDDVDDDDDDDDDGDDYDYDDDENNDNEDYDEDNDDDDDSANNKDEDFPTVTDADDNEEEDYEVTKDEKDIQGSYTSRDKQARQSIKQTSRFQSNISKKTRKFDCGYLIESCIHKAVASIRDSPRTEMDENIEGSRKKQRLELLLGALQDKGFKTGLLTLL